MFASIFFYICAKGFATTQGDAWINNLDYVSNAISSIRMRCANKFSHNNNGINMLGNEATVQSSSILLFLTSVTFGVSYSMTKIDIVDWIHTKWYLRLIRALLALGMSHGIQWAFEQ